MDGARCYRGSKGQSIQSNKCARCMVIYVPCDLSMAKIEPACPRGVTINTGERLHVVTKSLDRVKKEHPGILDGWKGGAELVAHINPSGDYYANLAPTDPTSLQWLRNILEYLPHCHFDKGTQCYTATLDSTINMLPFAISKGKQENVRRGGTPSIDLVDDGCHLRETMESSEAEAGTSEKASTRPATQRQTIAIERSPMKTQTPEKEEFGSARREAGPARRIRIEDRKDRSGTAASTTLARANDQSGASSPNKTLSASRDSKFLVDAMGFRSGATSSQPRIIRSTATSGEASRKAPPVYGGEVLSDSEVESRPKTRKRKRRSDSEDEGESEDERGGEPSSRKKLEDPQRTLTLHMIDSMPQHSMWYRKRLMVLEGIIDSHTEGEGGELTGLKTEIYQWYASTINGPIRSNIQ
ncbi:hypothetical protein FFLO_01912 [Filobasidium floriforme]|uniref:Uncharacterized protein n=1 Tax=Filobasidium floriforme TaxID=5210 RepID=A0A8K0JQJ2_9TREE|nr:uncharacterized protein HD553DRAFT_92604 [Filobasidium floriforme]KAG7562645.1 hypothetical protein FFLO_01912 [Filobasidium floriforme]KAH8089452.1 hypothetical protein HD553DRAFT_92604 [Filobasidium floriforme]